MSAAPHKAALSLVGRVPPLGGLTLTPIFFFFLRDVFLLRFSRVVAALRPLGEAQRARGRDIYGGVGGSEAAKPLHCM